MSLLALAIDLAETGRLPAPIVRAGVRRLCARRLRSATADEATFARAMRSGPVAPVPDAANRQHYEVPAEFFACCLGRRLKYSCAHWPRGVNSLDDAEAAALEATCQRAQLAGGQRILELGCGWGSLTLWMAERYPGAAIVAVSNSASQRAFIERRARERRLSNVAVLTRDMNDFDAAAEGLEPFDRVVSIEMFEHMRNYEELLRRVASWMTPAGRLFVHVFAHRASPYAFESDGDANWMGRHFFTGGIMPSLDLFDRFPRDLRVSERWTWDGSHYQRTAEAWLANLESRRDEAIAALQRAGETDPRRQFHRWRLFFIACAELFGYRGGREWMVGHYLFEPARQPARVAAGAP